MTKLKNLIQLAKEFNSILDKGESLEITELLKSLDSKQLFSWLKYRLHDNINLETFIASDLEEIQEVFLQISSTTEEFGVESNALNLGNNIHN